MILKLRLPWMVLATVGCWTGCGDDDHSGSRGTVHDDAGLDANTAQPDARLPEDAHLDGSGATFADAASGSSTAGDAQIAQAAGDAGTVEMDATAGDAEAIPQRDANAAEDADVRDASATASDAGKSIASPDAGLCTAGGTSSTPDVLIMMDASLSLLGSGMWSQVVSAVEQVTGAYDRRLAFGLSVFPPGGMASCSAGALDIPFGLMNAASIKSELDAITPAGLTPTAASLHAAHSFVGARTADHPAYIILITDGEPDCPGPNGGSDLGAEMVDEVKALFADNIYTFAVGSSDPVGVALLDQVATAGGTGKSYSGSSEVEYEEALSAIAGQLSDCVTAK